MKALVLESPNTLVLKDVPEPEVPDGWVLVHPSWCAICGSDYHSFRGENKLLTYPRIMGHETSGRVALSRSPLFHEGDEVLLMPYLSCGNCRPCRRGKSNCCDHLSVYGVHRDGALAEYYAAPADHLIKVPSGTDLSLAALVEPLSISAHAVWRSGAQFGDRVLVLGAGPIGTGVALMARNVIGADVTIADPVPERRDFVRTKFGFSSVLDPLDPGYAGRIRDLTDGELEDIVIDSTGNNASMAAGLTHLAHGGRMVWVGISGKPITLDGTAFHIRETELLDSRAAFPSDFARVLKAIAEKRIDPSRMITHTAPFAEAEEAFRTWEKLRGKVFKAIVKMD